MTIEEINRAIAYYTQLKEKVYALETGKYYDLDLSEDQKIKLNAEVDQIKTELIKNVGDIEIGIPIKLKPKPGPVVMDPMMPISIGEK